MHLPGGSAINAVVEKVYLEYTDTLVSHRFGHQFILVTITELNLHFLSDYVNAEMMRQKFTIKAKPLKKSHVKVSYFD